MANYLSIDIGGTYIKYALLDDAEKLVHQQKTPTGGLRGQSPCPQGPPGPQAGPRGQSPCPIVKQVVDIASEYSACFDLAGIGISTAGIVDRNKGEIIYAGPTIKDYRGTNFKEALDPFGLPVHVTNDVDAALLGERWKGAAAGLNNVFCITLGTGIGGAWYDDGLVDGAHFQANSVGYLLYDPATKTNFEMRASTSALNQRIAEVLGCEWTSEKVFSEAKQGDDTCAIVIADWAREIASGLAQIIIMADPDCLIIGGGVSAQGDFLLNQIQQHIQAYLPKAFMKTNIQIAKLYNNAALYGALYPFLGGQSPDALKLS